MTVRWKPLIVLTGLFLIVAAMGLLAFTFAIPRNVGDLVQKARAEAKAKRYSFAQIEYRRALQAEPKNAAVHEEMAELLHKWLAEDPPADRTTRATLRQEYLAKLADAAKHGKSLPGPRRRLLLEALNRDDIGDALAWAGELIALDPKDPDANYAKAIEALEKKPADLIGAKERLDVLSADEPSSLRSTWIRAKLADLSGDEKGRDEALAQMRTAQADAKLSASDRLAKFRLQLLAVTIESDPAKLRDLVDQFSNETRKLAAEPEAASARIRNLGDGLQAVQRHLAAVAVKNPASKAEVTALADSLDGVAETIYAKAMETSGKTDLRAHLAYAEHLMSRDQPEKALEVASKALKLDIAGLAAFESTAAGLREIAIKAALQRGEADPQRFEKAEPFIVDLLASKVVRFTGMGHFFRGLIALDQSGLLSAAGVSPEAAKPTPVDPATRDKAVTELRLAAAALPEAATAQALYGVALILTGESGLGRQYLQTAYRLGGDDNRLEPRYQIWAAWSMLQAGYPEDAEPILTKLEAAVARGELTDKLTPTLHLLRGEAHEARNTDAELKLARDEFQKAIAAGQEKTTALQLRMAQIDFRLGDKKAGAEKLATVKADPKAGAAAATAERMAVQALIDSGNKDEASKQLVKARGEFPDSDELAELQATLQAANGDPAAAEKTLDEYLKSHKGRVALTMARARLLAGPLKRPDEARALLVGLVEKAETSAPLVQLAILDLSRKDNDNAAKTIATLRSKWKEAAAADLLDAQLSLANQDTKGAATHLDNALAKDPNNKVALFWKALLDERSGSKTKASQTLQAMLKDKPTKEIEDGLSLTKAAEWALADWALQDQDLDAAIKRFEGLILANPGGDLDRSARWKLVVARAGKGDLAKAKAEVAELLASPKTTFDERVQAADFYRRQGDDAACMAQLDLVLKAEPSNSAAAAYKALALASRGEPEKAATLLRAVIAAKKDQPSNLYLMLAAAENLAKPKDTAAKRALTALDEGIAKDPKSVELVQAKYQVMRILKDKDAVSFVEKVAQADPSPAMMGVLAEVYREERAYDKAEDVIRQLTKAMPKDARLAAMLVGIVSTRATEAAESGKLEVARKFDSEALQLIGTYRSRFPNDVNFPQAEWEIAIRKKDLNRARSLGDEITALDPGSPAGPLLRARLNAIEGKPEEVAQSFKDALSRSPGRVDIRLALAQADLANGKVDDALKQTKFVLDSERDQPTALLLRAQALVAQDGTPDQKKARREEAAKSIRDAIEVNPNFLEAYHLLAELRILQGDREKALNALRAGIKINANDDTGLSSLVYHLCEPQAGGKTADANDVADATKVAEEFGARDDRGVFALASAVGFQRAGRLDLALPWAEKAVKKIPRPGVHMTLGGILLAKAESTAGPTEARELLDRALVEYQAVLKSEPDAVEAVNNTAWILHRYLNRHADALAVAEPFAKRANPDTIPAEFLDTLGSIQESMNQASRAQDTYRAGLKKLPDHPALNFHLGRILASDPSSSVEAVACLQKAKASRSKLPPEMNKELDGLLKGLSK